MDRKKLLLLFMLIGLSTVPMLAQMGMTDQQVKEYVGMGMQQGKSQQQIATELARRGVTREQAERVRKLYEQDKKTSKGASQTTTDRRRNQTQNELASDKEYINNSFEFDNQNQTSGKVNRFITIQELEKGKEVTLKLDEYGNLVSDSLTI